MSATNRGGERRLDDHYVTPDWAIKRFLEAYKPPAGTWLDPCAASGELIIQARALRPENQYLAMELRPDAEAALAAVVPGTYYMGDFLSVNLSPKTVATVITNPPYSLALPFLNKCREVAYVTCFLLRIGFMCGGRGPYQANARPGLFFLPNRPSFTGDGADASEYAWYVYGDPNVAGRHFMLAETPSEEIRDWNRRARLIHQPQVEALPAAIPAAG